ncbi:hypothetical protein PVT68_02420 [Microbulbifer bruguierae]|uniref:DUF4760 domain-containing protein n=1 Tax=Microbulbifer bruguierae TaxID=3029061 RepID=A0ABY8NGJ3_9GAMM|nr:hypothetical protein [Microbulbifer bruguierae]WGL17167.1 hypothetical protein PVT68_02420 [Microbulbifer bruguierae]
MFEGYLAVLFGGLTVMVTAYFRERGKLQAMSEKMDIVTRAIEGVKQEYAFALEAVKSQNQVRIVAAERRLEAHQGAFALWMRLFSSIHTKEVQDVVRECLVYWSKNCVYMEPLAREAFYSAIQAARRHKEILDFNRGKDSLPVNENWNEIANAGNDIIRSVDLPPLTDENLAAIAKAQIKAK